jgi:SAM-dependent methyltransferase
VDWTLEQAYDAFPRVEQAFGEDLDESLSPRGPDMLFDLVAAFDLPRGAVALDVGCGEGAHAIALADRFGFTVTGIDPVPRHIHEAASAAGERDIAFVLGWAEHLPASDSTVDLIWCRDVLVHVVDLERAYGEFRRALKPGGHALIYQMFATDQLEPKEAAFLWRTMGVVPANADPARTEVAIAAAGMRIEQCLQLGTEWGEYAQEHGGKVGRKVLHAARLVRGRETYLRKYGQAAYDMMLGDCLWAVYAMIGKLTRRVYVLS